VAVVQKRTYPGGAALKILKRRGATVKQIGKITGTMKVVASSKLPGALLKAARVSPFYESMEDGFEALMPKLKETADDKNVLTVVVYTDKGLCGSTNNQITRSLEKERLENQRIVLWGEKGASAFEKSKHASKVIFSAHPSVKHPVTFSETSAVVGEMLNEQFDLVRIIFNKMIGPATSEVRELWLPSLTALESEDATAYLAPYELEAVASDELLASLNEYQLCAALNYCHYHNMAVEFFARRNSMENASKNAGEVGKKLNILYNKARQAAITTELGEIVSGAAAVDEMLKAKK
jgi:ATP synthase F1 gamma subunit